MTHKAIDRCKELTSTTGTGTLTLTGPVAGCVAMADTTAGLTMDGDTGWFTAENGTEWEVFLGTRVSSTQLARTTVIASSNAGAAVSFTAPPVVFSTVPASKISAVGPSFSAYLTAEQTGVVSATFTKVAFNAEEFDNGGCFDSTTNRRFTPNVAGYYQMSWNVRVQLASGNITIALGSLYKNGVEFKRGLQTTMTSGAATMIEQNCGGSALVYMNGTTDYLEVYGYGQGTSPKFGNTAAQTCFSGYLAALPGPPMVAPSATIGPAFRAGLSADQTGVVTTTFTKVALNLEEFDAGNCFDSTTNFRFTPDVPGYYLFTWLILGIGATLTGISSVIRKNGVSVGDSVYVPGTATSQRIVGTRLIYMNGTTDYVELWGYLVGTTLKFSAGVSETSFSGHFVRGA